MIKKYRILVLRGHVNFLISEIMLIFLFTLWEYYVYIQYILTISTLHCLIHSHLPAGTQVSSPDNPDNIYLSIYLSLSLPLSIYIGRERERERNKVSFKF